MGLRDSVVLWQKLRKQHKNIRETGWYDPFQMFCTMALSKQGLFKITDNSKRQMQAHFPSSPLICNFFHSLFLTGIVLFLSLDFIYTTPQFIPRTAQVKQVNSPGNILRTAQVKHHCVESSFYRSLS